MLMLIGMAIRPTAADVETIDRDPGIFALTARIVRALRRLAATTVAHVRVAHQRAIEAELYSSSSAWPHNHRSR